jgi:hypothetical protein
MVGLGLHIEIICISEIVIAHLGQCAEETSTLLGFHLEVEKEPSTKNAHCFNEYQRNFFAFYKGIFTSSSAAISSNV